MIYLYLFGTCFHFIYVFMIIANIMENGDILFFLTESTGIKKGVPLYSNLC